MLPEFDHEMATTRRVLEQVPADRYGWKPHAKSWTMGGLANHLSNLPHWAVVTIRQDAFDVAPPGEAPYRAPEAATPAELILQFDRNVVAAREALAGASDSRLMATWTLLHAGKQVFAMPRASAMRFFVMNHLIHHRGQLSLYFRLADLTVPVVYGPTADGGA
jgi:uncharacterized damage-inducible protein DinB